MSCRVNEKPWRSLLLYCVTTDSEDKRQRVQRFTQSNSFNASLEETPRAFLWLWQISLALSETRSSLTYTAARADRWTSNPLREEGAAAPAQGVELVLG